jgi:hypothetical protein
MTTATVAASFSDVDGVLARGLHMIVIGDPRLPLDVFAASADAARLLAPGALAFRPPLEIR